MAGKYGVESAGYLQAGLQAAQEANVKLLPIETQALKQAVYRRTTAMSKLLQAIENSDILGNPMP